MKILVFSVILLLMNLNGFLIMLADKRRAKGGKWRVPEKRLFLAALLLGGIGATAGMLVFRHKTQHWYFRFGFPAIAAAQIALLIWLVLNAQKFFC